MIKFDKDTINAVIFDVDGTLYQKDNKSTDGCGSIQDAHDFFRYSAFQRLSLGIPVEDVSRFLIDDYRERSKDHTLTEAIESIPLKIRLEFDELVKKYKSNGNVFRIEFGTSSTYLHNMLEKIRFDLILKRDEELIKTIEYLKQKEYNLGILTTETPRTVRTVLDTLGLNYKDFLMDTGDEYGILCSENVKNKKPSQEGFERLIEIYHPTDPRRIVYVGDDLDKDVKAAMSCGLQAIHISNPEKESDTRKINDEELEYKIIKRIYDLRTIL